MAKGGGTQTSTTVSSPWAAQQPYLKDIFSQAEQLQKNPLEAYQGNTYAGKTGYDTTAQQQILQAGAAGQQLANTGASNLGTGLNAPDVANNSYVQNAIRAAQTPVIDRFTREVLPSIRSGAGAAGQYGSSRQAIVEGNAINDLTRNLSDSAHTAEMQAYDTGMRSYLSTMGMLPSLQAMQGYQGLMTGQVGQSERGFEQQIIDDAIGKWNFQQMEPWQRLGLYKDAVGGNYGGTSSSTMPGQPGSSGLSRVLGGVGSGLGMYGMLAMNPATAPFALAGALGFGGLSAIQ